MFRTLILASVVATVGVVPHVHAQDQAATSSNAFMASQESGQWLSDGFLGTEVQNPGGETIGDVNALVIDRNNEVIGILVGVGGFLGIGEKTVGVQFDAFSRKSGANGDPALMLDVSKAELDRAPAYERAQGSGGAFQQVQDAASEAADKAREMGEDAVEGAQEMGEEAQEEASEMMDGSQSDSDTSKSDQNSKSGSESQQ
jgi:hypothetical protein